MQPIVLMNPRKRRRRRKAKWFPLVAHKRNPKKRRRSPKSVMRLFRGARRNPILPSGLVQSQLMPAAQGAAGAVALDLVLGYAPIPPTWKTGYTRHLLKAGLAVAIGAAIEKASSRAAGRAAAIGALTVVLHDAARETIAANFKNVKLGEYLSDDELGEYLSYVATDEDPEALGYDSVAMPVGMGDYEEVNTAEI